MKYLITVLLVLMLVLGCSEKQQKSEQNTIAQDETKAVDDNVTADVTIPKEETPVENPKPVSEEGIETEPEEVRHNEVKQTETTLSESELWSIYRDARSKVDIAVEDKKWSVVRENLIKTAEAAEQLSREDIAAWQYNNIGYYTIEEFKQVTDYFTIMEQLDQLDFGEEKKIRYKQMITIFSKNLYLLEENKPYLLKAQDIDSTLDDKIRTSRIENNLNFINEIEEMVSKYESNK